MYIQDVQRFSPPIKLSLCLQLNIPIKKHKICLLNHWKGESKTNIRNNNIYLKKYIVFL